MSSVVPGNKATLSDQVARTLKQRVRTGVYRPGSVLPTVRALSEEFDVSLNVVQRAVRTLEQTGVIATHQGRGMTVVEEDPCRKAAILFGFIQPYSANFTFENQVFHYADRVFNGRHNFLVTRSSNGSAENEREVAEHFYHNGVRGLLLWPIDNDPNVKFFRDLAARIPVALVDRVLEGSDLPAVVHDNYENGRVICRHLMKELGKKRVLVLMDNLDISSYRDLTQGLHDETVALGRMTDLTILQLPLTKFIGKLTTNFSSEVRAYELYAQRLLKEGGYDALFCPQGEFVDYVMVETGLYREFPDLKMGIMCGTIPDPNLTKLSELGVLQWRIDYPAMISRAAELLQQWVLTREAPRKTACLKVELAERQTT